MNDEPTNKPIEDILNELYDLGLKKLPRVMKHADESTFDTRKQVLELRRSDPLHEVYTDADIGKIVGVSRQRVHQILTGYIQPHHRTQSQPYVEPSRYENERWFKHRRTNKHRPTTYDPKNLGRNYKPKKDND